ncbi:MAG: diacylglycerol kinase family lipid kinase [Chloroflexi bacterium]|nr:diacylglycerol kinase family lipid kinase [Chloroflexota bacterium]
MSKVRLIFNPASDRGRSGQKASDLRAVVEEFGGADWTGTEYPAHATELAAQAGLDGYETVVALGGDGTVHEVVNGLMRVAPNHRPKLRVLPIGSGNDFAFGAGVAMDPAEAMKRVFTGATKAIDIGSIRDNNHRLEYWNNTVGIGFDAKVNIMSRKITNMYGFAMYLVSTLRTIAQDYESAQEKIWFDDLPPVERDVLMLTLGNGPREGGGFLTTPSSKVDDGKFEYALIGHVNRPTILQLLPRVMQGTHITSKHVTMGAFHKLRLEADRALPIHTDGELWSPYEVNTRAIEVEIIPAAIQLLI